MSPLSPHLLNQEPPRAQQLSLPDFLVVPHLGHTELTATGAGMAGVGVAVSGRTDLSINQRCGDTTDMSNAPQTSHPPATLKSATVLTGGSPVIAIVALGESAVIRGVRVLKGWSTELLRE